MGVHALTSLKEGNLQASLEGLQQEVRSDSADPKKRIFLFQLLCVLGQWDRASTQLEVAGELDPGALAMVQTYREALRCEFLRARVFAGARSPMIFGEPETWLAELAESVKLAADGHWARSATLRERAFEAAPAASGTIDGQPFDWIADADMRLGPVLEAIVNGRYYWIPFSRIQEIHIEEPSDLRDMVWAPVHFRWANDGEAVGLIPTRYPGTENVEEDALRLARKTSWEEAGEGLFVGRGQRMFATDQAEYSMLDVRRITLNTALDAADAPSVSDA